MASLEVHVYDMRILCYVHVLLCTDMCMHNVAICDMCIYNYDCFFINGGWYRVSKVCVATKDSQVCLELMA